MEGKRTEERTMTVSPFSPPLHSEMFRSMPWEQECKTSALVTKAFQGTREGRECEDKSEQKLTFVKMLFLTFVVNALK